MTPLEHNVPWVPKSLHHNKTSIRSAVFSYRSSVKSSDRQTDRRPGSSSIAIVRIRRERKSDTERYGIGCVDLSVIIRLLKLNEICKVVYSVANMNYVRVRHRVLELENMK